VNGECPDQIHVSLDNFQHDLKKKMQFPRTAPPEDEIEITVQSEFSAESRPVVIVSATPEQSMLRPLVDSRTTAGIIGNRRTNFLQRQIYGQHNIDSENTSSGALLSRD
jgi:hypothetical protein